MKISIVGTGYVGLSIAILLAQNNDVIALDLDKEKVDLINNKISPIDDNEIKDYLKNKKLNLIATLDKCLAYEGADFIIVATPTDYDIESNFFDVSTIESVIKDAIHLNPNALIVIKSTIPMGYVLSLREKFKTQNIIFSPEFLREGSALYDNLHPSRVVVGDMSNKAKSFANLLVEGAIKKDIPVLYTNPSEAEAIKLYANSYLALRVAYFNELDSYCEIKDLNTRQIINGVCLDPRIGNHYNNPSFGYGGYCLPKDTKQLLANYKGIPQNIISSIVSSNETRMDHIAKQIIKDSPKKIGIYRLIMKSNSDNFRSSAIQGVMTRLLKMNISITIFEPELLRGNFEGIIIDNNFDSFIRDSDVILANRFDKRIMEYKSKVYTRDLFNKD